MFGSSGNFKAQRLPSAPFRLFMSADEHFVYARADAGRTLDRGRAAAAPGPVAGPLAGPHALGRPGLDRGTGVLSLVLPPTLLGRYRLVALDGGSPLGPGCANAWASRSATTSPGC